MAAKTSYSEDFVGGSYAYRSTGQSCQKSINLYQEDAEGLGAKVPRTLVSVPGSVFEAQIVGVDEETGSACRGLLQASTGPGGAPRLWGVWGTGLYRVNSDFSKVKVGTIAAGEAVVGLAENGFVIAVADGSAGLKTASLTADDASVASTFQTITIPKYSSGGVDYDVKPRTICWLLQRFVVDGGAEAPFGLVFYSEPASVSFVDTYGVLNFFSAEQSSDSITDLEAVAGRLWIFGPRSREIWAPKSDGFLAYSSGSALPIGCASRRSVSVIGDNVFFFGANAAGAGIAFASGPDGTPSRISTNALEHEWATFADRDSCIGFAHTFEGHLFYALTFLADGRTMVYDLTTKTWHERAERDWATGKMTAWAPLYCAEAWGRVHYGSVDGKLLRLDANENTNSGALLFRQRVSPIFWADADPVFLREIQLDCEIGTTPNLPSAPAVLCEVSSDAGKTWNELGWRNLGRKGEYRAAPRWYNCGYGRSIAVRISVTANCPVTIYGLRYTAQKAVRR